MNHQEICNGKLIIMSYDSYEGLLQLCERLPRTKSDKAYVILEDMGDGTYTILKNRHGKIGDVVTQKEVTKFMLRY